MNRHVLVTVLLAVFAVGPFVERPVRASNKPGLDEKPEHQESKFYARQYLSETAALNLQKEQDDRVIKTKIELSDTQRTHIQDNQRVGLFTEKHTVYKIYDSEDADRPYRYAVPLKQPGQHEYMDLMYGVNRDGTIHRIDLMIYREPHGSEIESRRFMGQFEGRSLESSEFQVNYDVIHIAGATISSKSTARGARKVLAILRIKGLTE